MFCRKIQTRLLVATAFVSYIQTRLPLTTGFVCLLLGHRNSSPLMCPLFLSLSCWFFFFLACAMLLLPPSQWLSPSLAISTNLSLSPRFCFHGHHHHVEVLSRPPPPRRGASEATTTTTQTPPPRLSLSLTFSSYTAVTPTIIEGYLFLFLYSNFFGLTWFYIFRSLPLLCRLFSTIVVHTLPLSLLFRFVHLMFLFN